MYYRPGELRPGQLVELLFRPDVVAEAEATIKLDKIHVVVRPLKPPKPELAEFLYRDGPLYVFRVGIARMAFTMGAGESLNNREGQRFAVRDPVPVAVKRRKQR